MAPVSGVCVMGVTLYDITGLVPSFKIKQNSRHYNVIQCMSEGFTMYKLD